MEHQKQYVLVKNETSLMMSDVNDVTERDMKRPRKSCKLKFTGLSRGNAPTENRMTPRGSPDKTLEVSFQKGSFLVTLLAVHSVYLSWVGQELNYII